VFVTAVLLDLDGLLVDTEPLQVEALRAAVAPLGVTLPNDYVAAKIVGVSDTQNAVDIAADFGLTIDPGEIVKRKDREFVKLAAGQTIAARPGLWEFMTRIRPRAARLGLVSSSSRQTVDAIFGGVASPAGHGSLADCFDLIVTGSDVALAKPAPAVYQHALTALGVATESCVAVEDSAAGVTAARAAGIRCLAVPNALTRGQDFSEAWLVCRSLGAAASAIEALLPAEGASGRCRE